MDISENQDKLQAGRLALSRALKTSKSRIRLVANPGRIHPLSVTLGLPNGIDQVWEGSSNGSILSIQQDDTTLNATEKGEQLDRFELSSQKRSHPTTQRDVSDIKCRGKKALAKPMFTLTLS